MNSVPQRRAVVRVTGEDGVTWEGEGETLALAMQDLGRKHRRGEFAAGPGDRGEETHWKLTPKGEAAAALLRAGRSAEGEAP